jgi:hypothetical protein
MRSADSLSTSRALPPAPIAPPPPAKDGVFREMGLVPGPPASIPTNNLGDSTTAISGGGIAQGIARGLQFRRMRSVERWRNGGGWFADRSRERDERERERERDGEREEREERNRRLGLGNWI